MNISVVFESASSKRPLNALTWKNQLKVEEMEKMGKRRNLSFGSVALLFFLDYVSSELPKSSVTNKFSFKKY